jgi:hypothetical protein
VAASAGVVDTALHAWRQQLSTVGGPSPLLHFVDAPTTRVELSSTHPGGLPQFISGKSTLRTGSNSVISVKVTGKYVNGKVKGTIAYLTDGVSCADRSYSAKYYGVNPQG